MSTNATDVFKLIGFIQDDLRGIQGKLVAVRAMLASLNIREEGPRFVCPRCGVGYGSAGRVAEHLENVHGVMPEVAA